MVHRTARGGSGRRLPESIDDYTKLDRFAAQMSLELVERIRDTYGSYSGLLRAHMRDSSAPLRLQGDPGNKKVFNNAKRAISERIGSSSSVIAEWDLVEFILTCCPREGDADDAGGDAVRRWLAGLWLASQRYEPPGYDGPVDVPEDAPPPYASFEEAPTDAIRVELLRKQLRRAEQTIRRQAGELAHRDDCERMVIRAVSVQQKEIDDLRRQLERAASGTATGDLLAENSRLRREHNDMRTWYGRREQRIRNDLTAKLTQEQAAHNLTANRMAMMTAMFDAVRADGDADPVQWLRNADFPLGTDLYAMLNHPGPAGSPRSVSARRRTEGGQPEIAAQRRFLAVHLRTFLINKFGHVPSHDDDPTGLYRSIVRDGTLPPIAVLTQALAAQTVTLQFARPLLDALAADEKRAIHVGSAAVADITPQPGPEHHNSTAAEPGENESSENTPDVTKPGGTKPGGTKPDETKPDETKPDETKPDETKPDETKAGENESGGEGDPAALEVGTADVRTLDVLGGEHRAAVLDKPVNAVDLINNLTLTRRPISTR